MTKHSSNIRRFPCRKVVTQYFQNSFDIRRSAPPCHRKICEFPMPASICNNYALWWLRDSLEAHGEKVALSSWVVCDGFEVCCDPLQVPSIPRERRQHYNFMAKGAIAVTSLRSRPGYQGWESMRCSEDDVVATDSLRGTSSQFGRLSPFGA